MLTPTNAITVESIIQYMLHAVSTDNSLGKGLTTYRIFFSFSELYPTMQNHKTEKAFRGQSYRTVCAEKIRRDDLSKIDRART